MRASEGRGCNVQVTDYIESSRGLSFVQIDYASAYPMPLHAHDDVASLNFCLAGSVQETHNRKTIDMCPSSLSLMPVGVPHANHFSPGARTFLIVLDTQWIERIRQITTIIDTPFFNQAPRPTWIAARMYREFQCRDALSALALEGMLLELLAELARDKAGFGDDTPPWLHQTTEYLHAHFLDTLSTQEIAAAVGVHPAHLMRSFRRHKRCTVGEYMRGLRVEYACQLLSTTDASLSQIALDTGFSDQSHFNRTFKAQTGVSPTEFRAASYKRAICRQKTQS